MNASGVLLHASIQAAGLVIAAAFLVAFAVRCWRFWHPKEAA